MQQSDLIIERTENPHSCIVPFSCRGCQQTITPIPSGDLRRTVNGKLIYLGSSQHHKYRSTIVGKDKMPLALDGIWRGEVLKIGSIQRLIQAVPKHYKRINLYRQPVPDSIQIFLGDGTSTPPVGTDGTVVQLPASFSGGFVAYRPLMQMVVREFVMDTDERGQAIGWRLELEEL